MILLLDNFDSFTYNLVDYFNQLGVRTRVIRNNADFQQVQKATFSGICLSPGPGIPGNSGILMRVIEEYHTQIPILGICLGHQALGQYFGATLDHGLQPMHGKVSQIVRHAESLLFKGLPEQFNVVRYHSLVLKNLPSTLVGTAYTNQQELMALRHESLPLHGVQFHPEAVLTQFGLEILQNWVTEYKLF